jgi:hypothetical protein
VDNIRAMFLQRPAAHKSSDDVDSVYSDSDESIYVAPSPNSSLECS